MAIELLDLEIRMKDAGEGDRFRGFLITRFPLRVGFTRLASFIAWPGFPASNPPGGGYRSLANRFPVAVWPVVVHRHLLVLIAHVGGFVPWACWRVGTW